jgi:hypothetical protein
MIANEMTVHEMIANDMTVNEMTANEITVDEIQGILAEGEGSVTPTCLGQLLFILKLISFLFYKTTNINLEVNCTESLPSVSLTGYYQLHIVPQPAVRVLNW